MTSQTDDNEKLNQIWEALLDDHIDMYNQDRESSAALGVDIAVAKESLMAWRDAAIAKTEKAYGGCHDCYGKGYATVNDRWHGNDTDQDIGSPGGHVSGGDSNAMKLCTCDRGQQLGGQIAKILGMSSKS